jgi:hypothetical protein
MKVIFASVVLSVFLLSPALAFTIQGAPAPLAGAGLPGLGIALVYGAYLLARRRRNNAG